MVLKMTSIRQFQKMMKDIYFHHDSKRGAKATYEWLKSEVTELGEALEKRDVKGLKEEFADVFAWLCSLANLLDIDLETTCYERYPNRCPKCGNNPCTCPFRKAPL